MPLHDFDKWTLLVKPQLKPVMAWTFLMSWSSSFM